MALAAGTKLGPYEIQSPLGAGGRGEVYRGRDTRLDRTAAVKILPTQLSGNPEFKHRFEREARTKEVASGFSLSARARSAAKRLRDHVPGSPAARRQPLGVKDALAIDYRLATFNRFAL